MCVDDVCDQEDSTGRGLQFSDQRRRVVYRPRLGLSPQSEMRVDLLSPILSRLGLKVVSVIPGRNKNYHYSRVPTRRTFPA